MKKKQPKDSEVATVCVYHFDGPFSYNAWGLYDAVQDGKVKPGQFIIAQVVGGEQNDAVSEKAHAIAKAVHKMNSMSTFLINQLMNQ